ncbi:MAG: hypothetical protein ABSF03_22950 [Streptosporangiaceae bacterium]|jgi:hypothetical protein
MPVDDENDEPQPGDTVIELRDTPRSGTRSGTRNERGGGPLAVSPQRGGQAKGADTSRFYELLDELDHQAGGPRMLSDCTAHSGWPAHGVYFFFEDGESRTAGQGPRVVRAGTTTGRTLWDRLAKHRGRQASEASTFALAAGPRRAHSVFRRHLGAAIITRDHPGWPPEVLDNWYHYHPQPLEEQIEREVSQYIGVMPFLWLDVPGNRDRHDIEAGAIGLLSMRTGDADPPSDDWLGRHAYRKEIRDSGLWNVQLINEPYDPGFLDLMAARVQAHR